MRAWRQFHNQPAGSPLDRWLRALWEAVEVHTGGRLAVVTCPENDGIPGGDPAALEMLRAGEIQFCTLMGGLLGTVAPSAEITGLPFAFRDSTQVFAALDGALGDYLRQALAERGIWAVPRACFENGFRHITTSRGPVRTVDDLEGLRIRTPSGRMFLDFFETLGARPAPINLNRLHAALRQGMVDAQENPLVMIEVNRLYEVQRYLSLTGHMWSGFNLLANLEAWRSLPADVRAVIERTAAACAARQREEVDTANRALVDGLAQRGLIVNEAETVSFRRRLAPFYARWRTILGERAWTLLETVTGPIGSA